MSHQFYARRMRARGPSQAPCHPIYRDEEEINYQEPTRPGPAFKPRPKPPSKQVRDKGRSESFHGKKGKESQAEADKKLD